MCRERGQLSELAKLPGCRRAAGVPSNSDTHEPGRHMKCGEGASLCFVSTAPFGLQSVQKHKRNESECENLPAWWELSCFAALFYPAGKT